MDGVWVQVEEEKEEEISLLCYNNGDAEIH